MNKSIFARWRANFLAGLAIVTPGVISFAVLIWLFGTIANVTDSLLVFLPPDLTHRDGGNGPLLWYWSAVAFVLALLLVCGVGLVARYYLGKRVIEWVDSVLLRVPLLNKIYGTIKQVNDAFSAGHKNAFRTAVLIEFPRAGVYSLGFITSEQQGELAVHSSEKLFCVFVPTTPNPTSGFLVLAPDSQLTRLQMSVADAIKYIVSVGSIVPEASLRSGPLKSPELVPLNNG